MFPSVKNSIFLPAGIKNPIFKTSKKEFILLSIVPMKFQPLGTFPGFSKLQEAKVIGAFEK